MSKEEFINGFKVIYEEDAQDGIRYLRDRLERDYAKVFFEYAREHGDAPFEDQEGRKYELAYEREVYMLTKKKY